MREKKGKM